MNKKFLLLGAMALTLAVSSCKKDDNTVSSEMTVEEAQNIDYSSDNAKAWGNYAANVAKLLQEDATTLYDSWNNSYAAAFKAHNGNSTSFTSAESCIEQIIDGCVDIANEVGESKIGSPYKKYMAGNTQDALYSVESWYSWHSRDDYKNNILSVANSLLGKRLSCSPSQYSYRDSIAAETVNMNSILVNCMNNDDLRTAAITAWTATCTAWDAIDAIPQPFRKNINSNEASNAMTACANLVDALKALKNAINSNTSSTNKIDWDATVTNYVDVVVLPTYKDLKEQNTILYNTVYKFQQNPSNEAFEACCAQWLKARAPWETSEAFLFGPVSKLGLDPNMDSWPLDAVAIVNLLQSENWSSMNWSGEYEEMDEEDEDNSSAQAKAISAAQSVRGFHTLEFLIFKDGQARTVK